MPALHFPQLKASLQARSSTRMRGETLTGHLAQPEGDGPFPAILVIQEWWGLDNHIRDVTNRFAHEGFVALAPDLYHGVSTTEPDEARKLVMELDMEEAVREIRSGFDYVLAQDSVAGDTVGIVGFCMGGRLVLATSLADDRLGAAVAFYGTPLAPEEAAGATPILGIYGENDGGIPVDSVLAMGDASRMPDRKRNPRLQGAEHASSTTRGQATMPMTRRTHGQRPWPGSVTLAVCLDTSLCRHGRCRRAYRPATPHKRLLNADHRPGLTLLPDECYTPNHLPIVSPLRPRRHPTTIFVNGAVWRQTQNRGSRPPVSSRACSSWPAPPRYRSQRQRPPSRP